MHKYRIIITLLLIALISGFFYLFFLKNKVVLNTFQPTNNFGVMVQTTSTSFVSSTKKITSTPVIEPKKTVQKPKPVIPKTKPKPAPVVSEPEPVAPPPVNNSTGISANGVLFFTNKAREVNGELSQLKSNSILNLIATKRVDNMFGYQYFSHNSPDNMDMINLAKSEGYVYGALGENIIMGDFDSSAEVVNTWMNSTGHCANILGTQYTEIGIVIKKGLYNGREQWIGVQIFGRQLNY